MREKKIDQRLIEDFERHLVSEEKSRATIEKYLRDARAFLKFVRDRVISKDLVLEYKRELVSGNYSPRSINSMIASVNSFLTFAGYGRFNMRGLRIQRAVYCSEEKELTRNEYERLVKAAEKMGNCRISLIIQTICSSGIRVSELGFITVEAVQKGEATVTLKGKTRSVFIVKELRKKLLRYAAEKRISSGRIFVTRSGREISRTNIWREMKELCKNANVDERKVFPHNLRHLFARIFYRMDKDIAKLADILGHSSINTTRIYIITSGSEHRCRMEMMHLVL